MIRTASFKSVILGSACIAAITTAGHAEEFNISSGDLKTALSIYARQTGASVIVSGDAVKGVRTKGAQGDLSPDDALSHILSGTGFTMRRDPSGAFAIVRGTSAINETAVEPLQLAQAAPSSRGPVETVTVTSSKLGGADVQSIPISITALSQEQLTATQTAGGPDLVKQVPNLTFTKTNFTGYSIQIRGIGTQAISVTTDPAVAVALNDIPFIRNHFFEQEFYDLAQAEVLRGPQGTLYGRNATAGVVNLVTAKPTDQFEAMASGEIGSYHQHRFEGMMNLPLVDDRVDLRIAGEWTKRQGYSFNSITDQRIDGRDLWSGRVTLSFKPIENLQTTLVWEHFSEDDDRMRTAKQLCKTAEPPTSVNGVPAPSGALSRDAAFELDGDYLSQGCLPSSLYSARCVPGALWVFASLFGRARRGQRRGAGTDPYANTVQSRNLRIIESAINPSYQRQKRYDRT